MAANPKDPMGKFYKKDYADAPRSNFNWSYKNRLSMDFNYLVPVGLWDVPADHHFECDMHSVLSSNPTLTPILGNVKWRAEAYFVPKATYIRELRNNNRMRLDRNYSFPYVSIGQVNGNDDFTEYSAPTSLVEYIGSHPAGLTNHTFAYPQASGYSEKFPVLNGIPILMYYDIYRNFYINPQDDLIPIRNLGWAPTDEDEQPLLIEDVFVTRDDFDHFISDSITNSEDEDVNIRTSFNRCFGMSLFPRSSGVKQVPTSRDKMLGYHHALLRRTLNNDFFTAFISNDNVNIITDFGRVDTSRGEISVQQISLANRNWRLMTRSALWGTDWHDFNKVHYGVDIPRGYGKPMFLGALSSDVVFQDVISQTQSGSNIDNPVTNNQNLGSRAGIAYGGLSSYRKDDNGKKRRRKFIEFNTTEEGYVMVLMSLTPDVDYFQGVDPMFFKRNLQHSWMLELNSVGMQDFMRAWMTVLPDLSSSRTITWEEWNVAEHKVPIWFEYMGKYNQLHGLMADDEIYRSWTFARAFSDIGRFYHNVGMGNDEVYTSTYGLPEMFNYPFASYLGTDNFQVQVRFDCQVSSMLDKQIISYL